MSLVIAVFNDLQTAEKLYSDLVSRGYLLDDVALWQGKEELLSLSESVTEGVAREAREQEALPIDMVNSNVNEIMKNIQLEIAAQGSVAVGLRT
ncbi:MAG: hypothetical protein PHH90_09705, partial [Limnochordia bacterium]|nr:hypothetical protein [Limnochordia bacterium]